MGKLQRALRFQLDAQGYYKEITRGYKGRGYKGTVGLKFELILGEVTKGPLDLVLELVERLLKKA